MNWEIGTRPKQKLSKQSLNHKEKMRTQSKYIEIDESKGKVEQLNFS